MENKINLFAKIITNKPKFLEIIRRKIIQSILSGQQLTIEQMKLIVNEIHTSLNKKTIKIINDNSCWLLVEYREKVRVYSFEPEKIIISFTAKNDIEEHFKDVEGWNTNWQESHVFLTCPQTYDKQHQFVIAAAACLCLDRGEENGVQQLDVKHITEIRANLVATLEEASFKFNHAFPGR